MLKYVSIILLIVFMSKGTHAYEWMPFSVKGEVDGTISKDRLQEQLVEKFKEDLISKDNGLLVKESKYSSTGLSETVYKHIALNSVITKVDSSDLGLEGDLIYLVVHGAYKVQPLVYQNYVDGYFENDVMRRKIDDMEAQILAYKQALKSMANSGKDLASLARLKRNIGSVEGQVQHLIGALGEDELEVLFVNTVGQSQLLAKEVDLGYQAGLSSFTHSIKNISIENPEADMPYAKLTLEYSFDWTQLLTALPEDITIKRCNFGKKSYIMIRRPFDGFPEAIYRHIPRSRVVALEIGGVVKELMVANANYCGSNVKSGRFLKLAEKGQIVANVASVKSGKELASRIDTLTLSNFHEEDQKLLGY